VIQTEKLETCVEVLKAAGATKNAGATTIREKLKIVSNIYGKNCK